MEERTERHAWFITAILPYEPDLRRCMVRLGVRTADIEDFTAETLARAYSCDAWRRVERSKSFLFQIARNLVCDAARRRSVADFDFRADMDELGLVDDGPSPEALVGERQNLQIMRDAIAALPPAYRELVRLRWSDELSVEDIAARLGLSVSTVEKRLASVLLRLRCETAARERAATPDFFHSPQSKLPKALKRQQRSSPKN